MKTIFVVDDDLDAAEVMAQALSASGRQVRAFSDPLRALAALRSDGADLLIADLAMPWIDGKDMLSSARLRDPGLPILLVSGMPGASQVAEREDVTFFSKPVDLDRLRRAVEQLLKQREARNHAAHR
jgi:DNA-binding NtrC family response regulator